METIIQETLQELLNKLTISIQRIRLEKRDENTYRINIESEEPSILIGRHGETMQSLQHLLKIMLSHKQQQPVNIIVDVDDYRKNQEQSIIQMAERKAEYVRSSARSESLPPMSSYFRRLVHLHIAQQYPDLTTESVGEGDYRYLTIKLKNAQI